MDELGSRPRLPLFLFGTLVDRDVLGHVLDRVIDAHEMSWALLPGHRRHAVVGAPYPVIRADRSAVVCGRVFHPRNDAERGRLDHFERGEYEPALVRVRVGGRMVDAITYRDLDGVFELAPDEWSLQRFVHHHKAAYLEACRGWMADYASV